MDGLINSSMKSRIVFIAHDPHLCHPDGLAGWTQGLVDAGLDGQARHGLHLAHPDFEQRIDGKGGIEVNYLFRLIILLVGVGV